MLKTIITTYTAINIHIDAMILANDILISFKIMSIKLKNTNKIVETKYDFAKPYLLNILNR